MSFGLPYGAKERDSTGKLYSVNTMKGERYVYYKRLNTDFAPGSPARLRGQALYNKAKSVLDWRIEYGGDPQEISSYFGKLASYEFAKEKALLEKHFKTSYDPNSIDCGKNLIEAFNTILSTKQIFERNALLIANTKQKGLFSFFPTYLDLALKEWINSKEFMDDIGKSFAITRGRSNTERFRKVVEKNIDDNTDKIVRLALEKMFGPETEAESGLKKYMGEEEFKELGKAYKEVLDAIQNIENVARTNEFVRGIAKNYKLNENLGKMIADSLKGKRLNMGNIQSAISNFKFKTTLTSNEAASLGGIDTEIFGNYLSTVTISNNGVDVSGFHTGIKPVPVNQKADIMIGVGFKDGATKAIEKKLEDFSGTGRGSNVRDMKRLLEETFKDFGDDGSFMLVINSKNWTLSSSFEKGYGDKIGGYSAGTPINLNTWDDMMHQMNIHGRDFIFTIMQLIPGAIGEKDDIERVSDMFARAIGSALFDDFEPDDPFKKKGPDLKTIHLLFLNGIYIPLSVFYTLLYEAFSEFEDSLDKNDLVQVEFNLPDSILYPRQRDQRGVEHPWGVQANAALNSITVSYHFLKGYKKFMKKFYDLS